MGNISFEPTHLQSVADSLDERHGDEDGNPSTISQDLALAKDYSLDPLSTNTMRGPTFLYSMKEISDISCQTTPESFPIGTSRKCWSADFKVWATAPSQEGSR